MQKTFKLIKMKMSEKPEDFLIHLDFVEENSEELATRDDILLDLSDSLKATEHDYRLVQKQYKIDKIKLCIVEKLNELQADMRFYEALYLRDYNFMISLAKFSHSTNPEQMNEIIKLINKLKKLVK